MKPGASVVFAAVCAVLLSVLFLAGATHAAAAPADDPVAGEPAKAPAAPLVFGAAEEPAGVDCSQQDVTNVPTADCNALVALYNSTNGAGWKYQQRWLQAPVCGLFGQVPWWGVGCDCSTSWSPYKCRVVSLWLQDNGLSGMVPPAFGGLAYLRQLVLKGNQLDGSGLEWLPNLSSLRSASLDGNGFGGEIPPGVGGLAQLETLSLGNNRVTGPIPPELGGLVQLKTLELYTNTLSGPIPAQLGGLANLETLSLANNQLEGDLPAWGATVAAAGATAPYASKLKVVDVSYNHLTGIKLEWGPGAPLRSVMLRGNRIKQSVPAALFKIPTLEFVDLGENQLAGNIPDVSAMTSLKILKLDHNNLTGGIPLNLDLLGNLEVLNLSHNSLDRMLDLPATSTLPKLYFLDLSHNKLWSSAPSQIGLLTGLKTLRLNDNQLSGAIPVQMGNLANLEELDLSRNRFSGDFPPWVAGFTYLKHLAMADIGTDQGPMGGQLPQAFGALTGLQHLDLHGLALTGVLPAGMAGMTGLTHLDLAWNGFEGSVPGGFSGLTKLQYLDLSMDPALDGLPLANLLQMQGLQYCDLSAGPAPAGQTIPPGLADLKALEVFGCRQCELTGGIPARLGELQALRVLDLSNNNLTGDIPNELSGLTALTILRLGETHLASAPAALGNLTNLQILDLAHSPNLVINDASWIGRLSSLKTLDLTEGPQIAGPIDWLGSLTNLQSAELSGCKFTGTLPALAGLTNLKALSLGGNQISALPEKIGPAGLETLDLAGNGATGALPTVWALWDLKALHLEDNHFTGPLPATMCALSRLEELVVEHNDGLKGELPRCLMNLSHLRLLQFHYTSLCEWIDPAFQLFLIQTDPALFLRTSNPACKGAPVTKTVGAAGGSLNSETDGTAYIFAPGAFGAAAQDARDVQGEVTVTHTQLLPEEAPPLGGLAAIRHFATVSATNASGQAVQPVRPYTLTVAYGAVDMTSGRASEGTLALYLWDGASWAKEPTSRLDTEANAVTATPGRFATWAVLGEPLAVRELYLPLLRR